MSEEDADDPDRDTRFLRAFLADRDAECPQCKYNLRDLTGDRCPECGEQLVLRIHLVEPKLGAMVAGLVGLSAGAGFSGLLLVYLAVQLITGIRNSEDWHVLFNVGPAFLIEGLLAVLWVAKWPKIRRYPLRRRAMLVSACWAATLINISVFSINIR